MLQVSRIFISDEEVERYINVREDVRVNRVRGKFLLAGSQIVLRWVA